MSLYHIQTAIFGVVVLIAVLVGLSVAEEMEGLDRAELCRSAHGPGWEPVSLSREGLVGPDATLYCGAPNGSVYVTPIHLTGPRYDNRLLNVVAVVLGAAVVARVLRWLSPSGRESPE